jgi:hypothetical protein
MLLQTILTVEFKRKRSFYIEMGQARSLGLSLVKVEQQ